MTKVADWMTPNPITIDENDSIIEAAHLMKDKQIRHLPVACQGRFCGIVTDRMLKEFTPGKATPLDTWEVHFVLSKTPIREVMNPDPFTTTPDTDLIDAARMIHDNKLYGLCVVNDRGELAGILTVTNMLEAMISILSRND